MLNARNTKEIIIINNRSANIKQFLSRQTFPGCQKCCESVDRNGIINALVIVEINYQQFAAELLETDYNPRPFGFFFDCPTCGKLSHINCKGHLGDSDYQYDFCFDFNRLSPPARGVANE